MTIANVLNGFRLFAGEKLNEIIAATNTLTANGANGGATAGVGSFTNLTTNGVAIETAQTLAAAGATQGNATLITKSVVIVTVSASTEGVKLPPSPLGKRVTVLADPVVGVKVYPNTNCQIEAVATNVAQALVKAKANIYWGVSATKWRAVVGA